MVATIEQHVNWVADCIGYMEQHGVGALEATQPAQDAWVEHGNAIAGCTLYPSFNSWYLGATVPGKPRVFMPYGGGFPAYAAKCNEVTASRFEGFLLRSR